MARPRASQVNARVDCTGKRTLFFVVHASVSHKALFLREGCIAVDTGKRELSSVNPHVDIDGIFPRGAGFIVVNTGKGTLSRVTAHVSHQLGVLSK
ncbi:hypothetical protein HPB51_025791 [Rhipicephalus microplus]|uniref:Uncharacterized protein n=1 Tax=Rhipicephalus microplus TaxID=6941 RepID=A0A9J6EJD8_RHIMP|nr:hypothetical protein HPB51_025791 [Rhipicephalus microplus]